MLIAVFKIFGTLSFPASQCVCYCCSTKIIGLLTCCNVSEDMTLVVVLIFALSCVAWTSVATTKSLFLPSFCSFHPHIWTNNFRGISVDSGSLFAYMPVTLIRECQQLHRQVKVYGDIFSYGSWITVRLVRCAGAQIKLFSRIALADRQLARYNACLHCISKITVQ